MKSEGFPYEIYKFIIEGIRASDTNGVLERFLGGPQEQFERDHRRIQDLKWLSDPAKCPDEHLDYLLALVGWDGTTGQRFIETLSPSSKRKLIKLSADLWKTKGREDNLINAIRVFTGKSVVVNDYFWTRCIIGESAMQFTSLRGDAWITGGFITKYDENLIWMYVNRQGLTSEDFRLIYELVNYIRPALEHVYITYVSFLDNFEADALARWTDTGIPGAIEITNNRMNLGPGAAAKPNASEAELSNWYNAWRWDCGLVYSNFRPGAVPEQGVSLTWNGDAGAGQTGKYIASVTLVDGGFTNQLRVRLQHQLPGGPVTTDATVDTVVPVVDPDLLPINPKALNNYFGFQVEIEAEDAVTTEVRVFVGGNKVLTNSYVGVRNFWQAADACEIARVGVDPDISIELDNVYIQVPPFYFQPIGQLPLGFSGIADPDPGLWPFFDLESIGVGYSLYWSNPKMKEAVIYDSARSGEAEKLRNWVPAPTSGAHITSFFTPFQDDIIWWANELEGGFPTVANPGPAFFSGGGGGSPQLLQFLYPGWADPEGWWQENAAAPGSLKGSAVDPFPNTPMVWRLGNGVTGHPSAQPRFWLYDSAANVPALTGPCWITVEIAQGEWEDNVAGGYDMDLPEYGQDESLKLQVNFGMGWETVREWWPRVDRSGDSIGGFGNFIAVRQAGQFDLRFIQTHYNQTADNWGISTLGVFNNAPPGSDFEVAHSPYGIWDWMSCGYQGNLSAGSVVMPGGVLPQTDQFFNPFLGTNDERFEMTIDTWVHLPIQRPRKADIESTTFNEWIEIWYESDATGGATERLTAISDQQRLAPPYPAEIQPDWLAIADENAAAPLEFTAGLGLPDDFRFQRAGEERGENWWQAVRIAVPDGEWQGSIGFNPSIKFVSGEAADGPYNATDIGMGVARVRSVVKRKE